MSSERKCTRRQLFTIVVPSLLIAACNRARHKNSQLTHEVLEEERLIRFARNHHPKLEGREIPLPKSIPASFKSVDLPNGLVLSEGYLYSPQEETIHGFKIHGGIDIEAPYKTPVYCPIDNLWVISSYYSTKLKGANGSIRTYREQVMNWGLGYFVQGYLDSGIQIQFAHLSNVAEGIPFSKPFFINEGWQPTNNNLDMNQLKNNPNVVKLNKGDLLGWVGCSGLQLGQDYDYTVDDNRQTQQELKNNYWESPHLHLEFYVRDPQTGMKIFQIDPFGIYSWVKDYPPTNTRGNLIKDPIFQVDSNGKVLFMDE